MSSASGGMRILLASMGAQEFSLLHATCEAAGHLPVAYVYSRSMRPRRPADAYAVSKVTEILEGVPCGVDLLLPADPAGLRDCLLGYRPDLLVLYGFNWILPPSVFGVPRFGTMNIHPSLLPLYRGPAPVGRELQPLAGRRIQQVTHRGCPASPPTTSHEEQQPAAHRRRR